LLTEVSSAAFLAGLPGCLRVHVLPSS
jgi:hypothetical protein